MAKNVLPIGMKVKQRGNEKEGMVVPDTFDLCNGGEVLVVWDGSINAATILAENLEVLGIIDLKIDHQKCQCCVFYRGIDCMRCIVGWDLVLESNVKNIIPDRIYPYCQFQCQSL